MDIFHTLGSGSLSGNAMLDFSGKANTSTHGLAENDTAISPLLAHCWIRCWICSHREQIKRMCFPGSRIGVYVMLFIIKYLHVGVYENYTQQTKSHCWIKVGPLLTTLGCTDISIVIHQVALILLPENQHSPHIDVAQVNPHCIISEVRTENQLTLSFKILWFHWWRDHEEIINFSNSNHWHNYINAQIYQICSYHFQLTADRVTCVGVHLFIIPPEVSRSSFSRHSVSKQPVCILSVRSPRVEPCN